jgi:hypothetical protein
MKNTSVLPCPLFLFLKLETTVDFMCIRGLTEKDLLDSELVKKS